MESLLPPKSLMRTGQGPDTVQGSRFLLGPDRWLGPAAALRGPSSQPDAFYLVILILFIGLLR